jgi:hypothetical protein
LSESSSSGRGADSDNEENLERVDEEERRKRIRFNLLRNKRRVPRRASKALGSRKTKRKNNRQSPR